MTAMQGLCTALGMLKMTGMWGPVMHFLWVWTKPITMICTYNNRLYRDRCAAQLNLYCNTAIFPLPVPNNNLQHLLGMHQQTLMDLKTGVHEDVVNLIVDIVHLAGWLTTFRCKWVSKYRHNTSDLQQKRKIPSHITVRILSLKHKGKRVWYSGSFPLQWFRPTYVCNT